jgi:hypothetical protein
LLDRGRCGGNFQQLQQRGIDADDGIYPVLAASAIGCWKHIKLMPNFLQLLNIFLF